MALASGAASLAIGGTHAGVLDTTFAEETETDLFGEQAVFQLTELMLNRPGFEPGPCHRCLSLAFGQGELRVLEVNDCLPEGLALFDIGDGFVQRPVDPCQRLYCDQ